MGILRPSLHFVAKKTKIAAKSWITGISQSFPGIADVLEIHYLISFIFALSLVLTFGEIILLRFHQVNENVFKVSD